PVAKEELPTSGERAQSRTRLAALRQTRRTGALGVPELIALGVAALFFVVAVAAYSLYLVPQRTRLASLGEERERLAKRLHDAAEVEAAHKGTNAIVADILDSLDRFETRTLAERDASSTGIIEELNEKTAHNALARAQFSFTHQEELTNEQLQQQQQRLAATGGTATGTGIAARKRQSIFPGIDISLTVEGSYANVRHFIHDIEASRRFIVIDGIELESVAEASAQRTAESKVERGQLVSLRLDMSAYFRRAAAQMGNTTNNAESTSH
ncbi:MAG TPA: GspMb/PilO family protein, partial [Pyrinomonadaceae bacterium]|nr:GspMb/PilO family protein [Pyrinomonadaceae bacterium]